MNHRRSTSRRRRGSRGGGRGRVGKRTTQALAAVVIAAAVAPLYADPIYFENPSGAGHFDWRGPLGTETWLDLTLPAASQPGVADGPSSIGQVEAADWGRLIGGSPDVELEVGGSPPVFAIGHPYPGDFCIPSGAPWDDDAYVYHSGFGSELPEGQLVCLGVRFDPGDGLHYGWIGVEREGAGLEPFAWGYESTPGVPVCFWPEPGTLALLALGAVVALRRRQATTAGERR